MEKTAKSRKKIAHPKAVTCTELKVMGKDWMLYCCAVLNQEQSFVVCYSQDTL